MSYFSEIKYNMSNNLEKTNIKKVWILLPSRDFKHFKVMPMKKQLEIHIKKERIWLVKGKNLDHRCSELRKIILVC